jgi:NAD(P)-dependent dehydrogenase (short-subunit alcohol dehydrogenase family)
MTQDNQNDRSTEEKAPDADEPILHLTDSAEDIDPLEATAELEEGLTDSIDDDEDDFVDSLGMEIGAEEDEEEAEHASGLDLDISPEQVDAALERVVQKMFYDRIDRILVTVIEKRVKREIDRIKSALIDEAGDDT